MACNSISITNLQLASNSWNGTSSKKLALRQHEDMSSARKATLEARLTLVQSAITATLTRGVQSYSTEIQSLQSMGLDALRNEERAIINELARLNRGSRFGKIGFGRVPG